MSHIPRHRKVKRASVLIKRSHCLRNYPNSKKCARSYKPLCEKLKNNNSLLAKALSKEKEENRLLFSQKVALIAEIQDLGLACNKRDIAITNILQNAKETLKMLVTVTGYVTNTISSCQELKASFSNNIQANSSVAKRESSRRLSTKSPAKGVVKPMVSGHTITKPTINLSRINMQLINNPTNLNIIHEVTSPIRSPERNNPRSPVAIRKRRYDSGPTCRMPERLISATRVSDENERASLSKRRSRHSGRMSGKLSRQVSNRLSSGGCSTRLSTEHIEQTGSPRVRLNDVSKLLQNTQTINIRTLNQKNSYCANETQGNNSDVHEESSTSVIEAESPSENSVNYNKDMEEESDDEYFDTEALPIKSSCKIQNSVPNREDPLEGPSWLFNDSQIVPLTSNDDKTDDPNASNESSINTSSKNVTMNNSESMEQSSSTNSTDNTAGDVSINRETDWETAANRKPEEDSFANTHEQLSNSNDNSREEEKEVPKNFPHFVTQRRGYYVESEDDDDFTLMYHAHPPNMKYDMNDLKMPVIEEFDKIPSIADDTEPEISVALQKISLVPSNMPITNYRVRESIMEQTVEQPSIVNNDYYMDEISLRDRLSGTLPPKATKSSTSKQLADEPSKNKNDKPKKRTMSGNNKDPSTVKVVLEKLNDHGVRAKTLSMEDMHTQDSKDRLTPVPSSPQKQDTSDSESGRTGVRPRRRVALKSLQEPSLRKKLRR